MTYKINNIANYPKLNEEFSSRSTQYNLRSQRTLSVEYNTQVNYIIYSSIYRMRWEWNSLLESTLRNQVTRLHILAFSSQN